MSVSIQNLVNYPLPTNNLTELGKNYWSLARQYAEGKTWEGNDVTSGEEGYESNSKYYRDQIQHLTQDFIRDHGAKVDTLYANMNSISTVANISPSVQTVASLSSEIDTILGIESEIRNVSGIKDEIASLAPIKDDIVTVASISNSILDIISNMSHITTLEPHLNEVDIVADNINEVISSLPNALKAEGYSVGTQNGQEVGSESIYYHNNAKYYAELAGSSVNSKMDKVPGAIVGNIPSFTSTGNVEDSSVAIDNIVKIEDIKDNLTSTDIDKPLSANQGKVLNDSKIDKVTNAVDNNIPKFSNEGLADSGVGINDIVAKTDIVNNTNQQDTNKPLSANMGYDLQSQINTLKAIGRFLSLWNCISGSATSDPFNQNPYTYKTGDYFIVNESKTHIKSTTSEYSDSSTYDVGNYCIYNDTLYVCIIEITVAEAFDPTHWDEVKDYKPTGTSYDPSTPSHTEELIEVLPNDVYIYDGLNWLYQSNNGGVVSFTNIKGNPHDNQALAAELTNIVKYDTPVPSTPVPINADQLNRKEDNVFIQRESLIPNDGAIKYNEDSNEFRKYNSDGSSSKIIYPISIERTSETPTLASNVNKTYIKDEYYPVILRYPGIRTSGLRGIYEIISSDCYLDRDSNNYFVIFHHPSIDESETTRLYEDFSSTFIDYLIQIGYLKEVEFKDVYPEELNTHPEKYVGAIDIANSNNIWMVAFDVTVFINKFSLHNIHKKGGVATDEVLVNSRPIGSFLWYFGYLNTIPDGYLVCNGQAVSRELYSDLFKVIGTKYGSGNGSTTFNIPDLSDGNGRFIRAGFNNSIIGTKQEDEIRNIKGAIGMNTNDDFSGAFNDAYGWGSGNYYGGTSSGASDKVIFNASADKNNFGSPMKGHADGDDIHPYDIYALPLICY